ncbi:amylo-alpha-1,6-glucosidase [Priestia flexa]|uniref:amylo-alpha-1,6-glucosidase n=1 Tax=Priestia flexa TaxID=86664 RepID=UPI0011A110E7|nr:amylo-alpha-1,6-glucosidase [Priestia flexa]
MDYRVIKENDLFLLTDQMGNITKNHQYGLGLYTKDTRFLSGLNIKINGEDPILLASDADETYMATIRLTNPHIKNEENLILWRESIEILRERFIYDGVLYETIKLKNYFPKRVDFTITVHMDVDFNDMFIVRGFQTGHVGKRSGQIISEQSLVFKYVGADDIYRATNIAWNRPSTSVTEKGQVEFHFSLDHEEVEEVVFTIQPQIGQEEPKAKLPVEIALSQLKDSYTKWEEKSTKVQTDHESLQRLINRGMNDLRVLLTNVGYGEFPVAGLPWFGVPFGRDSLIAALQMLPFNSSIAKGTLLTMAAYQGETLNSWRDEQPGKIMHEIRYGELANTNQIPFTPYYGTIDATPLFLILLTEYVKWTGDLKLVYRLENNIEKALMWIDEYGDRDGDLFLEYHQESSKGIANQGWKDSADSVVHRDGEYAKTPIALAEVQGYAYQAKAEVANLYEQIGKKEKAEKLRKEAVRLKEKFEQEFWMDDVLFYAIALDEHKKKVGTITSNPGHILFADMLNPEKVEHVANMLLSDKMFSGYGIRTMGKGEAGYNPMSYHDGSIWPHDNSMILLGLSKVGKQREANKVIEGLIDASAHFEYDRLPELFCGYSKTDGKPVKYPVACSPQAWAAGTPLTFIQTMLQLFPNSMKKQIVINPALLDSMNNLTVEHIQIGQGMLSVQVVKEKGEQVLKVLENSTGYKVVTSCRTVNCS